MGGGSDASWPIKDGGWVHPLNCPRMVHPELKMAGSDGTACGPGTVVVVASPGVGI